MVKKGLPHLFDGNGELYPWETYNSMLVHKRNDDTTIDGINGALTGRHIMKILSKDYEILTKSRSIWKELEHPDYEAYTDLDV